MSETTPVQAAYLQWIQSDRDSISESNLFAALRHHAAAIIYKMLNHQDPNLACEIAAKGIMESGTFRGDSTFSTWFHAVAVNCCLDRLREESKRREVPLETLDHKRYVQLVAEQYAEKTEFAPGLNLTPEEQRLWDLKVSGNSGDEISQQLNIGKEAVKKRWKKLKKKIRRALGRDLIGRLRL